MERRWWALPTTLTMLVVAACGAATATAGRNGATPSPADDPTSSGRQTALSGGQCRGWAISLASTDVHGAESPEAAANSTRFGVPPDFAFESTVWTTASSTIGGVSLTQESGSVEVAQMPNGSWYVMSGNRCE